jgi:nucleoid-associated protein YgaU
MSLRRLADAADPPWIGGPLRELDDALTDVALGVAALCTVWITLAVAAALLAAVPESVGRMARSIATAITPTLVHRAIALVLGTALSTATVPAVVANAAAPAETTAPRTFLPSAESEYPLLDRPASPSPTSPSERSVIVQPGDCLWAIAAARLPADASDAEIDHEWRRWYAVNRAVVGADPDRIYPGQVLTAPP